MGFVKRQLTMSTSVNTEMLKARLLPGLNYIIAISLLLAGPALVAASLGLALLSGDAVIAGLGMLGGAVLGAAGALALMWCLARSQKKALNSPAE